MFSENFCPMWGRTNFFGVGQKFSENFCPRTKVFIPWDKNFLKNFILGHFFSRTKIPVTVVRPLISVYRALTPLRENKCLATRD